MKTEKYDGLEWDVGRCCRQRPRSTSTFLCTSSTATAASTAQHLAETGDTEKIVVTFNADFAFMGSEEVEEDMQPGLVMYDDGKQVFWAFGGRSKKDSESVVKYVKDVLDQSA